MVFEHSVPPNLGLVRLINQRQGSCLVQNIGYLYGLALNLLDQFTGSGALLVEEACQAFKPLSQFRSEKEAGSLPSLLFLLSPSPYLFTCQGSV